MKSRIFAVFLIIPFLITSCNQAKIKYTPHEFNEEVAYHNPVIKGFFPDPSICKVEDDYYLVTSSFEFFPGVPLFHSKDLVNWEHIGNVLDRNSQLPLGNTSISGGIFAPVIRYHEGTFYMITTLMNDGLNFIVTTQDPKGPWSEPVLINQKNIDPSLFFDDDGKVYYTGTAPWSENSAPGVYQAEIDVRTGEFLTEYKHIWTGTGGRYPEGPHLYKIDGWYYLLISEGGTETGHFVTIARSESPWGPFESCPSNPILTNRNEPYSNPVQNSGHADIVQDGDGKWWMVHLAVRNVNKHHHLGRETFLLPMEWDKNGWPVINQNGVSTLDVYAVPPAPQQRNESYTGFEFMEDLGPEWNYIRNPINSNYQLDKEEGILRLTGSEYNLNDIANPTFLGIRQKDFKVELISKMMFSPVNEGEEAGITAFMTPQHYYAISMIRENGKNYIQSVMKVGLAKHIAEKQAFTGKEVWFKISSTPDIYQLYYSGDGENWIFMGENMAKLLSSETAGTFTGTYMGMFATGNGKRADAPAIFEFFDYESPGN
jgi:alpha-N-arabinofuranosidase